MSIQSPSHFNRGHPILTRLNHPVLYILNGVQRLLDTRLLVGIMQKVGFNLHARVNSVFHKARFHA